MPNKPRKPCAHPNCPELTNERFCEQHKKQDAAEYNRHHRDKQTDNFYKSRAWQAARARKLAVTPLCEECHRHGTMERATTVDHIQPIRMGGAPLEQANLQSLCNPCHSRKSAREGSRWGRRTGGGFEN